MVQVFRIQLVASGFADVDPACMFIAGDTTFKSGNTFPGMGIYIFPEVPNLTVKAININAFISRMVLHGQKLCMQFFFCANYALRFDKTYQDLCLCRRQLYFFTEQSDI